MDKQKEHRFWVSHEGSMVKIKLKYGDILDLHKSWDNGEGSSYATESWGFYYGNPKIISHVVSLSGNDCDGSYEDQIVRICHVDQLQALRPAKGREERRPNWKKRKY